jgi:hypothetical protein
MAHSREAAAQWAVRAARLWRCAPNGMYVMNSCGGGVDSWTQAAAML